jgi:hypothetical protein
MDNTSTVVYIGGMKHLYGVASSMIRDIDPGDKLQFMRIRTKKYEMMLNVNAGSNNNYIAISCKIIIIIVAFSYNSMLLQIPH